MATSEEISIYFGKSSQWLSVLRCKHQEKYKKITGFNKNIFDSIRAYIKYYEDIKEELSRIYYKLEKKEWYELIFKSNIYKYKQSVYKFDNIVFSSTEPLNCNYESLKNMEKVLKYYKENYYV